MDENDAYQSGEVFLSMVQTEYQNEKDRASALDSKIAFSIPIISTYFFLLIQDTDFKELWSSGAESGYFRAFIYLAAIFTAFSSLLWMISATWTHKLKKLDIRRSYPMKAMSMTKESFSVKVARDYLRKIEQDREENGDAYKKYQLGWLFSIGSLFCFLLYTLMT